MGWKEQTSEETAKWSFVEQTTRRISKVLVSEPKPHKTQHHNSMSEDQEFWNGSSTINIKILDNHHESMKKTALNQQQTHTYLST